MAGPGLLRSRRPGEDACRRVNRHTERQRSLVERVAQRLPGQVRVRRRGGKGQRRLRVGHLIAQRAQYRRTIDLGHHDREGFGRAERLIPCLRSGNGQRDRVALAALRFTRHPRESAVRGDRHPGGQRGRIQRERHGARLERPLRVRHIRLEGQILHFSDRTFADCGSAPHPRQHGVVGQRELALMADARRRLVARHQPAGAAVLEHAVGRRRTHAVGQQRPVVIRGDADTGHPCPVRRDNLQRVHRQNGQRIGLGACFNRIRHAAQLILDHAVKGLQTRGAFRHQHGVGKGQDRARQVTLKDDRLAVGIHLRPAIARNRRDAGQKLPRGGGECRSPQQRIERDPCGPHEAARHRHGCPGNVADRRLRRADIGQHQRRGGTGRHGIGHAVQLVFRHAG